jgi:CRP-like cAMP-binding protein
VAYLPALVFHEVERLDVVKMVRLLSSPQPRTDGLTPSCEAFANLVLRLFRTRTVLPRIARAVHDLPLFAGLNSEQVARLAGVCSFAVFEPQQVIFHQGQPASQMHVVLRGDVAISMAGSTAVIGTVHPGECLGEISLLTSGVHSATAMALTPVETAVLAHQDLAELIRLRPDIGLHIYKNLAIGAGEKLKRLDASLSGREGSI